MTIRGSPVQVISHADYIYHCCAIQLQNIYNGNRIITGSSYVSSFHFLLASSLTAVQA